MRASFPGEAEDQSSSNAFTGPPDRRQEDEPQAAAPLVTETGPAWIWNRPKANQPVEAGPRSNKLRKPEEGRTRSHGRSSSSSGATLDSTGDAPIQLDFVESGVQALPDRRVTSLNEKPFYYLGTSMILTIIILVLSMINSRGASTFWVSPAAVGLTNIFTLVLFVGLWREVRKNRRYEIQITRTQFNLHRSATPEVIVTDVRAHGPGYQLMRSIVDRERTEVCGWALMVLWAVCFILFVLRLVIWRTGAWSKEKLWEGILSFMEGLVVRQIALYLRSERRWRALHMLNG